MSLLKTLYSTTALAFVAAHATKEDVADWQVLIDGVLYISVDVAKNPEEE